MIIIIVETSATLADNDDMLQYMPMVVDHVRLLALLSFIITMVNSSMFSFI